MTPLVLYVVASMLALLLASLGGDSAAYLIGRIASPLLGYPWSLVADNYGVREGTTAGYWFDAGGMVLNTLIFFSIGRIRNRMRVPLPALRDERKIADQVSGAISGAIAKYMAGEQVAATCPSCKSPLRLAGGKSPHSVEVKCTCGLCSGQFEIAK